MTLDVDRLTEAIAKAGMPTSWLARQYAERIAREYAALADPPEPDWRMPESPDDVPHTTPRVYHLSGDPR